MLTCIACTKQLNANNGGSTQPEDRDDEVIGTPRNKQAMKSLTSQVDLSSLLISLSWTCFVQSQTNTKQFRWRDHSSLVGFCLGAKEQKIVKSMTQI